MAALATTDDVEDRLGRVLTDDEIVRVDSLLTDVSAMFRAYTGQQFTLAETTERLRVRNGEIRLPQRPVIDVTAVANVDAAPVEYTWDSGEVVTLSAGTWLSPWLVEPFRTGNVYVDVTYEHGYETVPEDIVALACQVVARSLGRTPDTTGVTQESIAGYSYSVGSAAAAGPAGLLPAEREVLDRYRRPLNNIRVGL